jgi:hypothetical protein
LARLLLGKTARELIVLHIQYSLTLAVERLDVVDLSAAKSSAVLVESILSQRFGQSVSNLIVGADGKNLDDPFSHVLAKMMVAYVDVLGARTKLRETSELEGARVVFKNLAVNDGLVANDLVPIVAHLLEQFHDWDHIAKGHR